MPLTLLWKIKIISYAATVSHGTALKRAQEEDMCRASYLAITRGTTLLGLLLMVLFASTARGDEPRLSISGYDPVAYFTVGKPVRGKAEFEYVWHKMRWRFASAEHRDLFIKDPERYAPQYDGYCALGAAIERGAQGHRGS